MASPRGPRDSQTSWPEPISVATAMKRLARDFDGEGLDPRVQHVAQAVAVDEAGAGEIEIEKAQHLAPRQLAREPLQRVELAGHVAAADQRADRRSGDDVGLDAGLRQRPQHADMRPSARGAGAQRETNLIVAHRHTPSGMGSDPLGRTP